MADLLYIRYRRILQIILILKKDIADDAALLRLKSKRETPIKHNTIFIETSLCLLYI